MLTLTNPNSIALSNVALSYTLPTGVTPSTTVSGSCSGYTIVPLDLHWTHGRAKLNIGLAKGKKLHDKRNTEKDRDWQREKGRTMRHDS
eukprot:gene52964-72294_t